MNEVSGNQAVETLIQAAKDLLFSSETDAPFVPFFWPSEGSAALTPETLAPFTNIKADTPIKGVKLDIFFHSATTEEEWHNEEDRAQVQRFQNLVRTIKATLDNVKVFRVGETKIDVYIVGQVEGGYAGLQTQVVET
jgi:hypothetical protein